MKIAFFGDTSPTSDNYEYFATQNTEKLFSDAVSVFEGNDFNFMNLEVALTEHTVGIEKFGPCLKAPLGTAKTLKQVGVTHCGLSNNHVFDFGKKGLNDTVAALEEAGIGYTGIGDNYEDSRKNLVLEKDGERVCIIAVCEHEYSYAIDDRMGSRPYDVFDTPADVRKAKAEFDKVVVVYHGGKEHCRYPSPRLVRVCRNLAESGADAVLCQHSHCIGCYEIYNGCHILYGQGNFHFTSSAPYSEGWKSGLAVYYDTKADKLDFTFCTMTDSGIELAKGDEKAKLEKEFAERNEILKNGGWKDGWHEFCVSVQDSYINNFKDVFSTKNGWKEYNYVGHALDCEAHHDVITELFPTANSTNETPRQTEKKTKKKSFIKKLLK